MARPLEIYPPLISASGVFSYADIFARLEWEGVPLGAFVTRPIGPPVRSGNPVVFAKGEGVIDSLGQPTQPPEEWVAEIEGIELSKPIIASIFAFTPADLAKVAEVVEPYAAALELNLSCPNKMPGERGLMTILADDPRQVKKAVRAVRKITEKPIIAKLSPNSDYLAVAKAALAAGADYLSCANGLGPGMAIDIWDRKPILAGISGGITGSAIKPLTLMMVYKLYQSIPLPIVAYGGVSRWEDVVEYMLAGAGLVGLGTIFAGKGTQEVVTMTNQLWDGVLAYLNGVDHREIIGKAHQGEPPQII